MTASVLTAFKFSTMKQSLAFATLLTFVVGYAPAHYSRGLLPSPARAGRAEHTEAQPQDERGLVALDQALREIANPFTVLYIAARPGDEDDGALAFVRKKLGARVAILFATRGEGEESPTRPELNEELGAVHTREAIEAARITGADVFFVNLPDIGYSKSAEEALSAWGHDEALRRMVRAVRLLRADVIMTDSGSGEGVQQAAARLALEAFAEAAGTKLAPEAGSEAWRTRRFFARTDRAGADVSINLDEYNHARGLTYAQIGLTAHHRFSSRAATLDRLTRERQTSYYKLVAPLPDEKLKRDAGLLDGLAIPENVTRSIAQPRVGDLGVVDAIAAGDRLVDALTEKLIEKRAEGTAATMHERYGAEFIRVVRFTAALERAIVLALGLNLEVSLSDRVVVPGQKLTVRAFLRNGSARGFPVAFSAPETLPIPAQTSGYQETEATGVATNGMATHEFAYEIAKDASVTLPLPAHLYGHEYYEVGSSLPGAQPAEPFGSDVVVSAEVGLGQVSVHLAALGRFYVAPAVEISTVPFALVKDWLTPRDIELPVRVRNRTPGPLEGALWVVPLALSNDNYEPVRISFVREDEEVTIRLKLRLPILKPPLAPDVLIEFRREKPAPPDPIGSAKIAVNAIDFETAESLKVGFVRGPDEWLSLALTQLGVDHSELQIADIMTNEHGSGATQSRAGCGDLNRFDTIIIDNYAYFTRPELMLNNRCLLRYAREGGNLLVLGQRPDDWNIVTSGTQFAPYPIKLSKDRITIEMSAVKMRDNDNPLMTRPNKITPLDFEGWLTDRAIDVPREWSAEYNPLLETSDPGQEPNSGGLLFAKYGDGTYIYTSFAWRRQLLNGNGGAYRMLANFISLPKSAKIAKPQK